MSQQLLERGGVQLSAAPEGLAVRGNVDFEVAAALAEAGAEWLATRPAGTHILLDLHGVERVSSAALSVLLEWTRRSRAADVTIREVRLSLPLERLTRVAGLDDLLPLAARA
ncbi:STAS domain-containing protein [Billgrantia pellis]|uniref:STAS domain-containing protein n=1 Tax=Billgrantia pellis TaxID=2606936 RepID=A0A7V7KIX4_9GAMM|nr:STAS domain-containing protein [Halomonas pellis]KAA0014239.1 STAS domain-containing protein [Halomonas pellis]